jgi:prepilin-type N-terminal cleavage/methylation domain-containing protein
VHNPQSGVSLMELLVVMFLLSLILLIAGMPLINLVTGSKLQATARELASNMRLAQREAISRGLACWIRFYESGNYRLSIPDDKGEYIHKLVQLPNGITVHRNLPTDLYFLPTGAPSMGGTVILESEQGEKLYVILTPATGRVRVSEEPPEWD